MNKILQKFIYVILLGLFPYISFSQIDTCICNSIREYKVTVPTPLSEYHKFPRLSKITDFNLENKQRISSDIYFSGLNTERGKLNRISLLTWNPIIFTSPDRNYSLNLTGPIYLFAITILSTYLNIV